MGVSSLLSIAILLAVAPFSIGQPGGDGGPPGDDTSSGGGLPPTSSDTGSDAPDCPTNGTNAHYEETLSGNGTSALRLTVSETGCPNHVNWAINPNDAKEAPTEQSIPAYPMLLADNATTDLSSASEALGIMRNGVALFSSWAFDVVVDYETTAFYIEGDTIDLCGGHATPDGVYHYHSTAGCLQEQAMVDAGTTAAEHSPLLGWSHDGFPVYGQLGPDGVEMLMCGEDGADATHCLDSCSGYEAEIDADEFKYRYYTSCGFDEAFFPFVVNCFRGCCPDGQTCGEHVEACGDSPENGYTADYVPAASTSLDVAYDTDLMSGIDTDYIDSNDTMDCGLYIGNESTINSVTVDASTPSPSMSATDVVIEASIPSPGSSSMTSAPSSEATSVTDDDISTPSTATSATGDEDSTPPPASSSMTSAPSSEATSVTDDDVSTPSTPTSATGDDDSTPSPASSSMTSAPSSNTGSTTTTSAATKDMASSSFSALSIAAFAMAATGVVFSL